MNDTQANQPVTASLVASNRRLTFLPTYFGPRLMMRGESLVYAWLRRLSEDYNGGFWNYYELSNGGFYLAPELTGRLCLEVDGNGYSGELSADAAGVVRSLGASNAVMVGHGWGGMIAWAAAVMPSPSLVWRWEAALKSNESPGGETTAMVLLMTRMLVRTPAAVSAMIGTPLKDSSSRSIFSISKPLCGLT